MKGLEEHQKYLQPLRVQVSSARIEQMAVWLSEQDGVAVEFAWAGAESLAYEATEPLWAYMESWMSQGEPPSTEQIRLLSKQLSPKVGEKLCGEYDPAVFYQETGSLLWAFKTLQTLINTPNLTVATMTVHRWRSAGKAGQLRYPQGARFSALTAENNPVQKERERDSARLAALFGLHPSVSVAEREKLREEERARKRAEEPLPAPPQD